MASNYDSNRNTSRIILVILGIAVLSGLGFFATKYFQEKRANEANVATIDELNIEIGDLDVKIEELQETITAKNVDLAEKDQLLEEKYAELETLVSKLARAKREGRGEKTKIEELEQRLADMRATLTRDRQLITQLEATVDTLRTTTVFQQEQISQLEDRNVATTEAYEATSEELEQTVQIASQLNTIRFRYFNVRKSGKQKENTEFRRGVMHQLRFCFTVMENRIAQLGDREIYMVYENPDGTVNANFSGGQSGKFLFQGQELTYSAIATINYAQQEQEVCMDFMPPEDTGYQKGSQYISLYADGRKIGSGEYRIK